MNLRKLKSSFYIFGLLGLVLLASCKPSPVYQKYVSIPNHAWDYSFKPTFDIKITDTQSLYNIYFLIRHTHAYPKSNIWLDITTMKPNGTSVDSRIEVPLAEPNGKWMGRGMNEIWEQRMPITRNDAPMRFQDTGTYTLKMAHINRLNPMPEILDVGIRIEKSTSNAQ